MIHDIAITTFAAVACAYYRGTCGKQDHINLCIYDFILRASHNADGHMRTSVS